MSGMTPREAAEFLNTNLPWDLWKLAGEDNDAVVAARTVLDHARTTPAVEVVSRAVDNGGGDSVALRSNLARNTWNYRVVRCSVDGDVLYGVHEAYDGGSSWTEEPVAPMADTLDGLREVLRAMSVAPEFAVIDGDTPAPAPHEEATEDALRDAVTDLLQRVGRMRDDWSECDKADQNALWRSVHTAAEHVGAILDAEDVQPWADELARLDTPDPAPERDEDGGVDR